MDWQNEWELTNTIPPAVEITLYLRPLDPHEPAVEMRRMVSIPRSPVELKAQ